MNSAENTEAGPRNVQQTFTTNDNTIIKEMKHLGKSLKPDQQEIGIQDEASAAVEADTKVTQAAWRRTAQNACIERYEYHIVYNRVFRVPICKQGCKPRFRIVNFANGKAVALRYDCYK